GKLSNRAVSLVHEQQVPVSIALMQTRINVNIENYYCKLYRSSLILSVIPGRKSRGKIGSYSFMEPKVGSSDMNQQITGSTRVGGHSVVIGGSMAGLLAARVLADHFERVTIIERDRFPEG